MRQWLEAAFSFEAEAYQAIYKSYPAGGIEKPPEKGILLP
jgi:hypothetical protein